MVNGRHSSLKILKKCLTFTNSNSVMEVVDYEENYHDVKLKHSWEKQHLEDYLPPILRQITDCYN